MDYLVETGLQSAASWLAAGLLLCCCALPRPDAKWSPLVPSLGLTALLAARSVRKAAEATGYRVFERQEAERALLQADLQAPPEEAKASDPDADLRRRLGV